MPTFATPESIDLSLEIGVGDVRLVASDRPDTVVVVRPSDPSKQSDVNAAQLTRVDYANGVLTIKAPKPKGWRQYTARGDWESIDVEVDLPSGSHLRGSGGVAAVRGTGRFGEVRFKTGVGDIHLEQVGPLELKTGAGRITIGRASGEATITTGSGAVEIDNIGAAAEIKNSNGDTRIGEAGGDLRVRAANGKILVDRAKAAVTAKTANGDILLREVSHGAISAETARGRVDIGVLEGVAAWLDLDTHFGAVRNRLDEAAAPPAGAETVDVRARTAFGDISVSRSVPTRSGETVG